MLATVHLAARPHYCAYAHPHQVLCTEKPNLHVLCLLLGLHTAAAGAIDSDAATNPSTITVCTAGSLHQHSLPSVWRTTYMQLVALQLHVIAHGHASALFCLCAGWRRQLACLAAP